MPSPAVKVWLFIVLLVKQASKWDRNMEEHLGRKESRGRKGG